MDSRLMEIRSRKAAGEHLSVIRLAQQITERPEGLTDLDMIDVTRMGATAAMAVRCVHEAAQFADAEREWAETNGDSLLTAVAAFHQGTVRLDMGDLHMALEYFGAFVTADGSGRPELDRYRGAVWFNVGTARLGRREYPEARSAFHTSRAACVAVGDTYGTIRSYLQEAWSDLMADRSEPAEYHLQQAASLLADHHHDEMQLTAMVYRALHDLRTGRVTDALSRCEEVLGTDRPGIRHHHRADASWIAGECGLMTGRLAEATAFADMALHAALEGVLSSAMNRANDLRRRISLARGETA